VARSERLIKPGDSWFSSKAIEVAPHSGALGGRALFRLGGHPDLPNRGKLRIPRARNRDCLAWETRGGW